MGMQRSVAVAALVACGGPAQTPADATAPCIESPVTGTIDGCFGVSGAAYAVVSGGRARARRVAVMPDDSIAVIGEVMDAGYARRVVLARFSADGALAGVTVPESPHDLGLEVGQVALSP